MPATALASGGLMSAIAVRQPVGVVACITPYNFPIVNMAGKIGPALAMGNTVVVKPAPQDPLAVTVFGEVLHEAGFPAGVVNVVTGSSPEAGQALVASSHVDMVSFTGSTPVGRAIGEAAGRDMKRLLLELGGKGAAIVFDDADLKTAIGTIASVWAFHSGQICTAPTRVIAQRGVYDQVVAGLQAAAGRLKVGDPLEPDTVVGPLISAVQRDRVEALIQTGVEQGGELVAGGERPADGHRLLRRAHAARRLQARQRGRAAGVLRSGRRGRALRRRGRGRHHRQRHRVRPLRLRVQRRHRRAACGSPSSCAPATSASTPPSATTKRPSAASR